MEQITKADGGGYYYGKRYCATADEAYECFRTDYNRSMGKQFYKWLNRIGKRTERVHTFGFVFASDVESDAGEFKHLPKVKSRLFGFVGGISLCRVTGCWDEPQFDDEQKYERWVDWAFSRGSGALRLVDTQHKHGRTNKKLRKRYR